LDAQERARVDLPPAAGAQASVPPLRAGQPGLSRPRAELGKSDNRSSMNILLTGGAGYIGSHTYVALAAAGYTPVILDNFSNSHRNVLERLRRITDRAVICEEGDVLDTPLVEQLLRKHDIAGVVHFAGDK